MPRPFNIGEIKFWLEIIGSFPEREGKYLICPVNSSTRKNYPMYRILEELRKGDIVFHCVLGKANNWEKLTAITSYSRVQDSCYRVNNHDHLCSYPPPYRRIDIIENTLLEKQITLEMLAPHREQLERIVTESGTTRTPFNKNFQLKQMYLARIPKGFIRIFEETSGTAFNFPF
jgi:hypothetical protein